MTSRSPIRDWLRKAVQEAIPGLLCDVGCARLSVDDIARRVGVAKGALLCRPRDVDAMIDATLESWTDRFLEASWPADPTFREICETLLRRVPEGPVSRSAAPCCLTVSPCPHRWFARWNRIATAMGLGSTDIAFALGEAVQAIASYPQVQALLTEGRDDEAVQVILGTVGLEEE